jgi:hypothetical protein
MALALLRAVLETPKVAALQEVTGKWKGKWKVREPQLKELIQCTKIPYVKEWFGAISR